jgi:hypothetical protein
MEAYFLAGRNKACRELKDLAIRKGVASQSLFDRGLDRCSIGTLVQLSGNPTPGMPELKNLFEGYPDAREREMRIYEAATAIGLCRINKIPFQLEMAYNGILHAEKG